MALPSKHSLPRAAASRRWQCVPGAAVIVPSMTRSVSFLPGHLVFGCHCEPVRTLVWQSVPLNALPTKYALPKDADSHVASLLGMTRKYDTAQKLPAPPVIASQCAHWRGNPLSMTALPTKLPPSPGGGESPLILRARCGYIRYHLRRSVSSLLSLSRSATPAPLLSRFFGNFLAGARKLPPRRERHFQLSTRFLRDMDSHVGLCPPRNDTDVRYSADHFPFSISPAPLQLRRLSCIMEL